MIKLGWVKASLVALVAGLLAQPVQAAEFEAGRTKAQAAVVRLAELLSAQEKAHLGLAGGNAKTIHLGRPLPAYAISKSDLAQATNQTLGGLLKETDLVYWPVRIEGTERAGVWMKRVDKDWQAAGVGEKEMAASLAEAQAGLNKHLISQNLLDPFQVRLLSLDWAACRFLVVLVRDRVLLWPLPPAARLLRLKPDYYPLAEIAPMLTGRTAE
jgi:hypothetical protein